MVQCTFPMDLKSTLNLPDADFTIPMKADLPQREPEIQAKWEAGRLYHRVQEVRKDAPTFVLHDGPPYTNSPIHLGTAFNKVLKDFIVKSHSLMGFRCPYVPGYDNHGLPIEQAVMRGFHERKLSPTIEELRAACREHANKYIGVQTEQFKRLGVLGHWERPYVTMDFRYEAEIVRVFKRLVEKDQVYRGLRPVLWSPTARTALADTEIVYKDHVSKAIIVGFPLREGETGVLEGLTRVAALIWTTTPWTIPANLALAFHPEYRYAVMRSGEHHFLVLEDLSQSVMEQIGHPQAVPVRTLLGSELEHLKFKHPIFERDSLAVTAEYVTTEDGTGIVHTAPGHGRDDFFTGVRYGLPVLCPVDEKGILTEEAGEFAGVSYKDCDTVVVERLREVGALWSESDFTHSYPHAERDGKPVIFRATEQWFVSMSENGLRDKMLAEIEKVNWVPESGKNRITAMIANRPDWCISRQRPWGVGIPVFYGAKTGEPVLDPDTIEAVAQLIELEGSDAWFTKEAAEILPKGFVHPKTGETEFRKEVDVFDVWFDAGSTNICVLEGEVEPLWDKIWPADVYLEGSDQHRGWFNTSLIIGTVLKGGAPYKSVVTHGFLEMERGVKMSKRAGNMIDPVEVCEKYGADVLRYWAASVDYHYDAPCSEDILKQFGENYRRVRNTLRFLLANLSDFDPADEVELSNLDEWVIEQADLLVADVLDAYGRFEFNSAIVGIHNFCKQQLSEFYLDAIKDRIYCDGRDWPSRRSAQRACYEVLNRLTRLVAPILCHTAEEVFARIPGQTNRESVLLETLAAPGADRMDAIEGSELQDRFAFLLSYRAGVFAAFEAWKATNETKDGQDVVARITDSNEAIERLKAFGTDLPNYFKMSWVEFMVGQPKVEFEPSPYEKCERCRLRRPDVEVVNGVALSARDRRALGLEAVGSA